MIDQPEDLTLRLLREIRETLGEHGEILEDLRDEMVRTPNAVMAAVGYGLTNNNEIIQLQKSFKRLEEHGSSGRTATLSLKRPATAPL